MPNVPRQIRESVNAKFEKREKLLQAAALVPELYEGAEQEEIRTRKGKWTVYREKGYRPPLFIPPDTETPCDRFCAVYGREGRPRTIVRGNTADKEVITDTLRGITKRIIEQRPLVSRPGRSLTEENGVAQGIKIGLIFSVLLAAFVLFDYVLIPNYPEAFLQAADITQGKNVGGYSADAAIFSYESMTGRLVERLFPAQYKAFSTSVYTLLAVFILPVLAFGIVYEAAGKGADRRRMKRLPADAAGFQYGFEAAEALLAEHEKLRDEGKKRALYTRLTEHGLTMGKGQFEALYTEIVKKFEKK
jgi:hypothetical protein